MPVISRRQRARCPAVCLCLLLAAAAQSAFAAACAPPPQGEGRVAEIIDGRSFRLTDGREIRLAGIEPAGITKAERVNALSALVAGRDVSLRGDDDAPDRYGRQTAFVFLAASEVPVQAQLVSQGQALVLPDIENRDCVAALMAAEAEARAAKRGTWSVNDVIKNAESADDILAGVGHFTVVEGKVLSVRQSGATTYLNFGRHWTQDFAATIPRRVLPAFAAAGITLKSLENRRIRIRGWVEARPGPRIEVIRVGQIEVLGGN
ncbi:thermonuclease family protein [Bradyrhizobium sp. ARR65]|uniref:thermonuclease family protein n=1 Tax=Bradyrhizobium sp. ARR65 TaxID=1040989 RepID=UPI000685850B|nr:thermonuclease family protein [Bradyrhizobium sp. ARR65]